VPHLRLVGIDSDAEAVQADTEEGRAAALPAGAVVHARLNRAIHYMKPREGRPRLDLWFDAGFLNRLPRTLTAGGLRPLGRLAFVDNYRLLSQRLKDELKTCLDPESMSAAISHTGLALRTNRPRVYVLAGLGGGTAGGMFLDLAYAVRHYLKDVGYQDPEVVGLFLLPPLEKGATQKDAQVNAYAALTELNHFSAPGVKYAAKFDEREGTITEAKPPFGRFAVLHLPAEDDKGALESVLAQAGTYLYRELVTPLGKAADAARAAVPVPENVPRNPVCQNFGLARFWWPRWALLQRAARRLCRHLAQQWMSKDSTTPPEVVQNWIQEQWNQHELGFEFQVNRFQEACRKALGQDPEAAIAPAGDLFTAKRWGGKQLEPNAVKETVAKVLKLLGQPIASTVLNTPGLIEDAIKQEAEAMQADWDKKLLGATALLVERPEFHLAGAEDAIRKLIEHIDQALASYETLAKEFRERASHDHDRLQQLLPHLDRLTKGARSDAGYVAELVELLEVYPKRRYHSLRLKAVNQAYTQLRNKLTDQLRELGFFRTRLGELQRALEELELPGTANQAPDGFQLLPVGCKTLGEAVDRFIAALTPAEFEELDQHMHQLIQVQFRGLTHLCNSSSTMFRNLANAMLGEAVAFTSARLQATDVVEMFLGQFADEEEAQRTLAAAYEKAAPVCYVPGIASRTEFCILATPPSPLEEPFRRLAGQAVPAATLTPAASADDIVFYREEARLALDELEVLGPLVREAYRQKVTHDPGAAHTRTDVSEWREIIFK
jgi:hypothetical protein